MPANVRDLAREALAAEPVLGLRVLGPSEAARLEEILEALKPSYSMWEVLRALSRARRLENILVGDLLFVSYLAAGLVAEGREFAEECSVDFTVTRSSNSAIELAANVKTPNEPEPLSFGCTIHRLTKRRYLARDW